MSKSSWQMGGGKMETTVDERQGRAVGSHIILRGRVLGIELFVEEVVTAHHVPLRKEWETIGTPRLLVIGPYRMSFDLKGGDNGSRLHETNSACLAAHASLANNEDLSLAVG